LSGLFASRYIKRGTAAHPTCTSHGIGKQCIPSRRSDDAINFKPGSTLEAADRSLRRLVEVAIHVDLEPKVD